MTRWQQLNLGRVVLRLEVVLITLGLGILFRPSLALAFFLAVAAHELGHALAAAKVGRPFRWLIQVGGASPYLIQLTPRAEVSVALAGAGGGASLFALGFVLARRSPFEELAFFGADLAAVAALWSAFQLLPFPPLDGGLILRRILAERLGSALWAWRVGWALGFSIVVLVVWRFPNWLEPAVWLTVMTILLGRSEAGYVRHLDAYQAWSRGDHRLVLAKVKQPPDWLPKPDRERLHELGISAAVELEDPAALEQHAGAIPPQHPAAIRAAEWLLRHGRPYGARLAEHAYDALDAERVKAAELDRDRWADLMLHHAFYEAAEQRDESALGLLERAVKMGFDHLDRLEAEPRLERLRGHPRYLTLVRSLGGH